VVDIIHAWRITDQKYADSAFSGEGARLWGGRFNSPGTPAVYASGSLSLALLEILVQTNDRSNLENKVLVRAEIAATFIQSPSTNELPVHWNHIPVSKASQRYGDRWIDDKTTPVLRIPSVVVPMEYNFVINPKHQDFNQITLSSPCPLPLDPRFFGTL
jgi:RES domain-containing protein